MNTYNKRIVNLSFEILFAVLLIIGSYFTFCNNTTTKEVFAYNNYHKELDLKEIKPLVLTNAIPMTNDKALESYEKSIYQIINNNNSKVKYRLIYRIYNSPIKVEWFNYYLKINNKETISNLGNLGPKENIDYTDLILTEGIIDKLETKDVEYLIWLDSNVGNEAQNKSFDAKIILETY